MSTGASPETLNFVVTGLDQMDKASASLKNVTNSVQALARGLGEYAGIDAKITNATKTLEEGLTTLKETVRNAANQIVSVKETTRALNEETGKLSSTTISNTRIFSEETEILRLNTAELRKQVTARAQLRIDTARGANIPGVLGTGSIQPETRMATPGELANIKDAQDQIKNKVLEVDGASRNLGITWQGVTRIMIGSLISRTLREITMYLEQSASDAKELALRIGEIQTISQSNPQSFGSLTGQARGLSEKFGKDIKDEAEGIYQAISDQLVSGPDIKPFEEQVNRLATITVSSVKDAEQAMGGIIKAYKLSASDAQYVSDLLFKTVEQGHIRLEEVAHSLGTITAPAYELGISLKDLLATFIVLTRSGVSPTTALTELRNIIQKLTLPGKDMTEFLHSIGVESGTAAVQAYSFTGVLEKMGQSANQTDDALGTLAKYLRNVRGVAGGATLALDVDPAKNALKEFEDATRSADSAAQIMANNLGTKLNVEMEKIKNYFTVDIWLPILQNIIKLSDAFGSLVNVLKIIEPLVESALVTGLIIAATKTLGMVSALFKVTEAAKTAAIAVEGYNTVVATSAEVTAVAGAAATANPIGLVFASMAAGYLIIKEAMDAYFQESNEQYEHNVQVAKDSAEQIIQSETKKYSEITRAAEESSQKQSSFIRESVANIQASNNALAEMGDEQEAAEKLLYRLKYDNADAVGKKLLETQHLAAIEAEITKDAEAGKWKEATKAFNEYMSVLEKGEKYKKDKFGGTLVPYNEAVAALRKGHGGEAFEIRDRDIQYENGQPFLSLQNYQGGQKTKENELLQRLQEAFNKSNEPDLKGYSQNVKPAVDAALKAEIDNLKAKDDTVKNLKEVNAESIKATTSLTNYFSAAKAAINTLGQDNQYESIQKIVDEINSINSDTSTDKISGIKDEVAKQLEAFTYLSKLSPATTESKSGADLLQKVQDSLTYVKAYKEQLDQLTEKRKEDQAALARGEEIQASFSGLNTSLVDKNVDSIREHLQVLDSVSTQLHTSYDETNAKIRDSDERIESINKAIAAQYTGVATVTEGWRTQLEIIKQAEVEVNKLIEAEQNYQKQDPRGLINNIIKGTPVTPPVSTQFFGGPINRFAAGGIASDQIPAYLSAGEVVMNRMASNQNFSALVAMNAGVKNFNGGGTVSNFGDINITVQGGNTSSATIQQIGDGLRRAIRQGVVRLD